MLIAELRLVVVSRLQIQRAARMMLANRKVGLLRLIRLGRHHAAVDIQRAFRGHQGRILRAVLEKVRAVDAKNALQREREQRIHEEFQVHGAALRIQMMFRRRRAWKRLRNLLAINRQMMAIKVTDALRRWSAKCELARRKEAARLRRILEVSGCYSCRLGRSMVLTL